MTTDAYLTHTITFDGIEYEMTLRTGVMRNLADRARRNACAKAAIGGGGLTVKMAKPPTRAQRQAWTAHVREVNAALGADGATWARAYLLNDGKIRTNRGRVLPMSATPAETAAAVHAAHANG